MKKTTIRSTAILSAGIMMLVLSFTACKKDTASVNGSTTTTTFGAIKTTSNFNWSNSKTIAFSFTGSQGKGYNSILKVIAPDNSVIFQKLQNGSQNYAGSFTIPAAYPTVTVVFGNVTKTFITKNGTVGMNLN